METNQLVTVKCTYENWHYDPAEFWPDGKPNPGYDPEQTHEVEKPVCYVTVYEVSQQYGGPEEGGWHWFHYERKLSIPLIEPGSAKEIEEITAFLQPRFVNSGSISSCSGHGQEFAFYNEAEPGQHESKRRPRYE